jgi:hypothetical protein
MARERFTVGGNADRSVTSATVRVKRVEGTNPLTITLATSGGDVLASGTVTASAIPLSTVPEQISESQWDEESLAGGRWVTITFPALILRQGSTYDLQLSTAPDTTYVAVPLRELDDADPPWGSRAFRDGLAQRTVDGATWADVYEYGQLDLQFSLR